MNLLKVERCKIVKTRLKSCLKGCYIVFNRSKSFYKVHLNLFKGVFLSHTFGTFAFRMSKQELVYKSGSYKQKGTVLERVFKIYLIENQLVKLNLIKNNRPTF